MTTTVQVEAALRAMDGAGFQRLCDAYLRQRGVSSYISTGLVLGKEKTRTGIPDSVALGAEGHIFVETTTTASNALPAKLQADILNCLSPDKTGVPLTRVRQIYLFFTEHLDAGSIEALSALTRPHNIPLTLFGPHELAHELRYRFASLAQEHLGLSLDTGQVLDPHSFVARQSSTAIQTDLDSSFVERSAELKAIADLLGDTAQRPTILLVGNGGVGKTRLALEALRRAQASSPDTIVLCVRSRDLDASTDLRGALERRGRYLLLFDDANRIVNLSGLLDVVLEPLEGRDVRVLLTARDYIAHDIAQLLRERGPTATVPVARLTDDALRALLAGSFGIHNPLFQRRILELAAGNARVAVMAARSAVQGQNVSALRDATDIYRQFFGPLERTFPILASVTGLRVLGVLALVGNLDLTDTQLTDSLAPLHQVSHATFREALETLNDLELVDLHESTLARVSDQTFATYSLFLALFDRRVLSLTDALLTLYPLSRSTVLEALNAVGAAFSSEPVIDQVHASANAVWDRASSEWVPELFDSFVLAFAGIRPAEALQHAIARLSDRPEEPTSGTDPVSAKISFQESVTDTPTLLLGRYRFDHTLRGAALYALLEEARKHPPRVPVLLRFMWERYGFAPDTEWAALDSENALLDLLWSEAETDTRVAGPMYIAISGRALQTEHDSVAAGRKHSIVLTRFHLPRSDALRAFRDRQWGRLVSLCSCPSLRSSAFAAISTYAQGGLKVQERAHVRDDLARLEPLLLPLLDPNAASDQRLIRHLRQLRERFDLGLPESYAVFVSNARARLTELLLRDRAEGRRIGWNAANALRTIRLRRYGERMGATELLAVDDDLAALLSVYQDHDAYQIREGATVLLVAAAAVAPEAFAVLVRKWIASDNPLALNPVPLLDALTKATSAATTWDLVTGTTSTDAHTPWILAWLQLLPAEAWLPEHATVAASLLSSATAELLWRTQDLVQCIATVAPVEATALLYSLAARMVAEPTIARGWAVAFYDGSILATPVGEIFLRHPRLLGDFYLAMEAVEEHVDSHAVALSELLSIDTSFGVRWLDTMLVRSGRPSFSSSREYAVLWRRDDWESVLGGLAQHILDSEHPYFFGETFLCSLLRIPEGTPDADAIMVRQDALLGRLVRETSVQEDRRERLFRSIANLAPNRRRELIRTYLKLDPPVEEFASLNLEPTSFGWSGSEVPTLERRREFFESLLPLCDRTSLLPHRARIEQWVRGLAAELVRARRTDFLEERFGG